MAAGPPLSFVPDSSAVLHVAYRPDRRILDIRYAEGDLYSYSGVPEALYAELYAAHLGGDSIGQFVNARIKPHHPHEIEPRRRRFRPKT